MKLQSMSKVIILFLTMTCINSWAQKSDHIIYDSFGDWSVRHVFDRETLEFRYSDAKTPLLMSDGKVVEFQINRRGGDNWTAYILQGWWDKVIIRIGQKEFAHTESGLHTFYGTADLELLNAIANAADPIEIEKIIGDRSYKGTISPKGASAALRWIRVIK